MPYKTIVVHADLGVSAAGRIRLAARLARTFEAHLVGSAATGLSRFIPPDTIAAGGSALALHCAALRRRAAQALEDFERLAREEGVASSEARLVDDDLYGGMAIQARYCDLFVVGQTDRQQAAQEPLGDLPEYLLLTSGRPVLVVPSTGCAPQPGGDALVAWDRSVEAARAVAGALPLLRLGGVTTVLGFGDDDARCGPHEDPSTRLADYLGRHGVVTRIAHRTPNGDIGEALLSAAADAGASLLVMGGYGHARYRELVLGGVTATILRSMTLPVLFAH